MGLFNSRCQSQARLDGKVAVITGCNTGIGKETALDLVRRGAKVVMACRDVAKADLAAEEILLRTKDVPGAGSLVVAPLDLSSLASVRQCAQRILETEPAIHLLINNAGIMACPKASTAEGYEMQLGVNHLGHFLLTCLLLPRLRSSAPARVITVSSITHVGGVINFDDLQSEKSYSSTAAYTQSKLANILFTKELARRLEGTGVTAYALHPGVVATELSRHFSAGIFPGLTWLYNNVGGLCIKNPEQGAQTSIHCAVDEALAAESGFYYSECRRVNPSRRARDEATARRLWEVSAQLVHLGDWDPCTAPDHR